MSHTYSSTTSNPVINEELTELEVKPSRQPHRIGRMKREARYTQHNDTWSGIVFKCTDCKATVEADESTAEGVITAWDEEYHDCPYCVAIELRETDMKDLPDFGVF